jgi:hypothetical protein
LGPFLAGQPNRDGESSADRTGKCEPSPNEHCHTATDNIARYGSRGKRKCNKKRN